jgi:small GTP-binding protein
LAEEEYMENGDEWTSKPRVRAKVCLVGDAGVGKTSLIRRFILNQFDDKYIKTIGTKVSKKSLSLYDGFRERETEVVMTIWDIMGQEGFRELLKDAYFCGAHGIMAVCDVTNEETMNRLDGWLDRTYKIAGDVPVAILINKADLGLKEKIEERKIAQFGRAYESPFFYTSAKTGEGVEKAFADISTRILRRETSERKEELAFV